MLPRKLHLEQINRYHDKLDKLGEDIEKETDTNKKLELYFAWHKLFKYWSKIDDAIEELKDTLDNIER